MFFALGAVCLFLPALVSHPFFDTRWTNWVGLVTRKPITEDYVPVLPWLGVMLWGLAAGRRSAVGIELRRHAIEDRKTIDLMHDA